MLNDNQELAAEVLARHMAIVKYSSAPWDKLNDSERGRLMDDARFAIRVITPILADMPARVEIQIDEIPVQKMTREEAEEDLYGSEPLRDNDLIWLPGLRRARQLVAGRAEIAKQARASQMIADGDDLRPAAFHRGIQAAHELIVQTIGKIEGQS